MDKEFFKEKEFRPGSMGAAEAKTIKLIRIIGGIVYALVLAVIYLIPNYQNSLQERAGAVLGILGFIFILISYFFLYFWEAISDKFGGWGWSLLGMALFGFFGWQIAIGFNGDLIFR